MEWVIGALASLAVVSALAGKMIALSNRREHRWELRG